MFTYTWTDRPVVPALAHLGVYNVTVVELEGTKGVVRILSRVTDVEHDDLVVGLPVEVHFDPAGTRSRTRPTWRSPSSAPAPSRLSGGRRGRGSSGG